MFKHPAEVCMSYLQHMFFSLEMCFYFFMAAITAFIHAFLPDTFITSTSDSVKYIQKRLDDSGCRD